MWKFYLKNEEYNHIKDYNKLLYWIGKSNEKSTKSTTDADNKYWHYVKLGIAALQVRLGKRQHSKRMIKLCTMIKFEDGCTKSCYYIGKTKKIYDALYSIADEYKLLKAREQYIRPESMVNAKFKAVVPIQAQTIVNNQFSEAKMPDQQLNYINKLADFCVR